MEPGVAWRARNSYRQWRNASRQLYDVASGNTFRTPYAGECSRFRTAVRQPDQHRRAGSQTWSRRFAAAMSLIMNDRWQLHARLSPYIV
jgi:hypothetical protein